MDFHIEGFSYPKDTLFVVFWGVPQRKG